MEIARAQWCVCVYIYVYLQADIDIGNVMQIWKMSRVDIVFFDSFVRFGPRSVYISTCIFAIFFSTLSGSRYRCAILFPRKFNPAFPIISSNLYT